MAVHFLRPYEVTWKFSRKREPQMATRMKYSTTIQWSDKLILFSVRSLAQVATFQGYRIQGEELDFPRYLILHK